MEILNKSIDTSNHSSIFSDNSSDIENDDIAMMGLKIMAVMKKKKLAKHLCGK